MTTRPRPDKVDTFQQTLKVTLTSEEIATRADRSANLVSMITQAEEAKKAAADAAKAQISLLESELKLLSGEVRSRSTHRPVKCERRWNYQTGKVTESRLDTLNVLNQREMTVPEHQMELPFEGDDDDHAATCSRAHSEDETWREVPIGEALLDLPKKVYAAFLEVDIETMGDFATFQETNGDYWVKNLQGVGPSMAEKISEAAEAFWQRRRNGQQ